MDKSRMNSVKRTAIELENLHKNRVSPLPKHHLVICLHNIRSMHNVGSAFRSCDGFGVDELLLTGYTPAPPRIEISKTALGADEWIPWKQATDGVDLLRSYKASGWCLVAIEQTQKATLLPDGLPDPLTQPTLLIFGNEVMGIDDEVLDLVDRTIEIPQYGKKHSLNVSVSIGIVLFAVHEKGRSRSGFNPAD
jgi:tRNA G18 (ribose-2'-O)-methylase SpoU